MRRLFLIIFIINFINLLSADNLDSLLQISKTQKAEELSSTYNKIAREYIRIDLDKSLEYANLAIKKSKEINDNGQEAKAYLYKAVVFKKQNNYEKSKEFYQKTIKIAEDIKDTSLLSKSYNGLSQIEFSIANYEPALIYINKTIELKKALKDTRGQAIAYNTLGNIYLRQGDNKKAITNYQKAIKIFNKIGFKQGIATELNAIGSVYENLANYNNIDKFNEALNYYKQALKIYIEIDDKSNMANSYSNIGNIYSQTYEYYNDVIDDKTISKAIINDINSKKDSIYEIANKNLLKSLEIRTEINDLRGISSSNVNLAALSIIGENFKEAEKRAEEAIKVGEKLDDPYMQSVNYFYLASVKYKLKDYNNAKLAFDKSIEISKKVNLKKTEMEAYKLYSELDTAIGDYNNAYKKLVSYINLKDTILNEESAKVIEDLNKKYQTEKKEQDLKLANAENAKKDLENKKQKLLIYGFGAVIILIIVFAIFVFRQYREKKKANDLLAAKNDLITKQKEEITDSILYARRIQTAILPPGDYIEKILIDRFILFKPRDIVSGDFYWIKKDNKTNIVYATAADCTGHGVPGAFLSMLGVSFLNEIINRHDITHTGEVLDALRESVIKSLHQTGREGEAKDGMDISFIAYDVKNLKLEFSGANNPLYIIRKNDKPALEADKTISNDTHTLYEIKSDKMPIGIYGANVKDFRTINIDLEKDDAIYLFSDGYADQFGGPKGKKYKYKPYKQLLLDITSKPMEEQRTILETEHNNWKGNLEQVDDIIVIGIRV